MNSALMLEQSQQAARREQETRKMRSSGPTPMQLQTIVKLINSGRKKALQERDEEAKLR